MLPDEPRRRVRRPANGTGAVNYGALISEAVMRHEIAARRTNSVKRFCLHDRRQMGEVEKYAGSKQRSEFSTPLKSPSNGSQRWRCRHEPSDAIGAFRATTTRRRNLRAAGDIATASVLPFFSREDRLIVNG